jgi:hypothetical protein
VEAKVRERLSVNKQKSHSFHTKMFPLRKLNDMEGQEQFHVEIRFVALENVKYRSEK